MTLELSLTYDFFNHLYKQHIRAFFKLTIDVGQYSQSLTEGVGLLRLQNLLNSFIILHRVISGKNITFGR
jgi:hypothetical protein